MTTSNTFVMVITIVICGYAKSMPNERNHFETDKLKEAATHPAYPFPFYSKEMWGGDPSKDLTTQQSSPVPMVIIHHTYEPAACHSKVECFQAMREIQFMHQVTNGWNDVGYNFAVGGDGAVYEGRGWGVVGAHAAGFNANSTGIVLIGDWDGDLPPKLQLQVARKLISMGVELGFICPDYTLLGHRNVGMTDCPGQILYEEINSWDRFQRVRVQGDHS